MDELFPRVGAVAHRPLTQATDKNTIAVCTSVLLNHRPTKGHHMNWDTIQGNWKQLTGRAKQQWGKLTDDDLTLVAGHRDQLAGKIQERYGIAKDDAEEQLSAWEKSADDSWLNASSDAANAQKQQR
jgi:uncharacterized protein YjbJ (UPF0337 family)